MHHYVHWIGPNTASQQMMISLKERLDQTLIPTDLLELLDHTGTSASGSGGMMATSASSPSSANSSGGGLNPDAFARGLLKEAIPSLKAAFAHNPDNHAAKYSILDLESRAE